MVVQDYKHTIDLRRAVDGSPPSGRNPLFIPCLYHEDGERASLAVYPDGVQCFACGANKPPLRFIADLNGLDLKTDHAKVQAIADEIMQAGPVQAKQARKAEPPERLAENARRWVELLRQHDDGDYLMMGRGLSYETITRAWLGYTGRAYTIPLYDRGGLLFSVKYRRDDATDKDTATPKYWNHPGTPNRLYYPPLLDWAKFDGKPVVLVEGEYDALTLCQAGVPAVTCPTGVNGISTALAEIADRHSGLVLCLDNDQPGQAATNLLLIDGRKPTNRHSVAWSEEWGKDASEAFSSGHGEALKTALRRAYALAMTKGG